MRRELLRNPGELEVVAEYFENNFSKVLDDAAKADQNLASLLLTTDCESEQFVWRRKQVDKRCENNFSKLLDDDAKSRLESRFFAADN